MTKRKLSADKLNQRRVLADGTNHCDRTLKALDPSFVLVDERSNADLLRFVQLLSTQLVYYSVNAKGAVVKTGTWEAFAQPPPDHLPISLDEMVAFIDQPESFSAEAARWLGRPHFALMLSCVALLRHLRDQQNQFTKRHLEYYFEELLGSNPLPAEQDHVAVLFQLASHVQHLHLPADSRLRAGKDSSGLDRLYETEKDLVINRARVSQLRSVFVDRRIHTLEELTPCPASTQEQKEFLLLALRLALGQPQPGDPVLPLDTGATEVTLEALDQVWKELQSDLSTLALEPHELKDLIRLVRHRTGPEAAEEWKAINQLLKSSGAPPYGSRDSLYHPDIFLKNLETCVGKLDFSTLSLVSSIDDLYRKSFEPSRLDVQSFIANNLNELTTNDGRSALDVFRMLMGIKTRIDAEWTLINRWLEQAGRRLRQDFLWVLIIKDSTALEDNTTTSYNYNALSSTAIQWSYLETRFKRYSALEEHFSMPIEHVARLTDASNRLCSTPTIRIHPQSWEQLISILKGAHAEQYYTQRRKLLQTTWDNLDKRVYQGINLFDAFVGEALNQVSAGVSNDPPPAWSWEKAKETLARHLNDGQMTVLKLFRNQLDQPGIAPCLFAWTDVFAVLEYAQRMIKLDPQPFAQQIVWRNLYAADDARILRSTSTSTTSRWPPFGCLPEALPGDEHKPEPNLGFGIRSPLLALSKGGRTLTLTLEFQPDGHTSFLRLLGLATTDADSIDWKAILGTHLLIRASTSKASSGSAWVEITLEAATCNNSSWTLTLVADESVSPLAPLDGEDRPQLHLLLQSHWDDQAKQWITSGAFETLRLTSVSLKVHVTNLADLRLQHEDVHLDSRKPFQPFGSQPAVGSRFYLSHQELVRNNLDKATFSLTWMGLPNSLVGHYSNYLGLPGRLEQEKGAIASPDDFRVNVELLYFHQPVNKTVSFPLFNKTSVNATPPTQESTMDIKVPVESNDISCINLLDFQPSDDLRSDDRVWRWTLTPTDFGHSLYPALAAAMAQKLAIDLAQNPMAVHPTDYLINPPYTPMLKSITAEYTTYIRTFHPGEPTDGTTLLHVHPFGTAQIPAPIGLNDAAPFLPRYGNAGELYVGLDEVHAPQRVTLLVQLAEGTSDPDLMPASLQWSVLDDGDWRALSVVQDSTRGFLSSGIIELDLPAVAASTLLPSGHYWVRVAIERDPRSVCDCVDILSQVVAARFCDQDNAPEHYNAPLAANSITGLVSPDGRIAKVLQPFPSYGAKSAEGPEQIYRRVSEELRHKQRALSPWDYERLVLQQFGRRIHKVKCLPTLGDGKVEIIVIPDPGAGELADALAPVASSSLTEEIRSYLQAHAPPCAIVRIRHPLYVTVRVCIAVRINGDIDVSFLQPKLREDLHRYLAPWAYDEGVDIPIGGAYYATSIVAFVETLPYIDYVADIVLLVPGDPGGTLTQRIGSGLNASISALAADVVLVSTLEEVHLELISDAGDQRASLTGINHMRIGINFMVAPVTVDSG